MWFFRDIVFPIVLALLAFALIIFILNMILKFFSIDIPLIMPQIKYIFIMTFIDSVQNYARTYILGSSGTITPVENMYRIMTGTQADYGMASAYATILFVFLFLRISSAKTCSPLPPLIFTSTILLQAPKRLPTPSTT